MTGGLPVITLHPQSQTIGILTGDKSVTFTCLAEGEGLLYSWQRQGSQLPLNAATSTLVISGVREEDSGNYQCIVENRFGQVSSDYAALNVTGRKLLSYILICKYFCCYHKTLLSISKQVLVCCAAPKNMDCTQVT